MFVRVSARVASVAHVLGYCEQQKLKLMKWQVFAELGEAPRPAGADAAAQDSVVLAPADQRC